MTMMMEAVERVEERLEHLRDKAGQVEARAKEAVDEAKVKAQKALEETKAYVKEHPGRMIGASLALGALIGAILARKHKEPEKG